MNTPGRAVMTWLGISDQLAADQYGSQTAARVLGERERWAAETQAQLAAGAKAVVRLSARMPATLRTRGLAHSPVNRGVAAFEAECHRQGHGLRPGSSGWGPLGPWQLWVSDCEPVELKRVALQIEGANPAGQLLDLDVYSQDGPVSRSRLGLPPRLCVVCGQPAAVCTGRAIHTASAVEAAFLALMEPSSTTIPNAVAGRSRPRFQDFLQCSSSDFQQDLRTDAPLAPNRP